MVSRTLCICAIGLVAFLLTTLSDDPASGQTKVKLVGHLVADDTADATKVALLDINKVFENHAKFQQRFKELGERFKRFENELKKEPDELKRQGEELATLPAGTPERQEAEAKLAKRDSDFKSAIALEQKALAEDEAKIYRETYQEIEAKCENFAKERGISLILRNMQVEMKANDPNSVRMGLSRMVIYQRGLDITDEIIKALNDKGPIDPNAAMPKIDGALFAVDKSFGFSESN